VPARAGLIERVWNLAMNLLSVRDRDESVDQRDLCPRSRSANQPLALPWFVTTRSPSMQREGGQEFDVADGESGSAPKTRMVERERGHTAEG